MKPSYKDLIKASTICMSYNATISFAFTKDGSSVQCETREIEIDLDETIDRRWFWSLVFHELAHIECYDKKIYETYHYETLPDKKMYRYIKRMGLRIERYVDMLAKKNMKKHFPKLKFRRSYVTMRDVEWFHSWIEEEYGS